MMNLMPFLLSSTPPAGVGITSDMLSPLVDAVNSNLAVIVPVAIGIFGIILGVGLVPRIIQMFSRGK